MRDLRSNSLNSRAATRATWPAPIRPRFVVLLAGGMSASSLPSLLGRSVLDLPLSNSLRLLDLWKSRVAAFIRGAAQAGRLEVLLLLGESDPMPTLPTEGGGFEVRAERDSSGYRGTAGALRDLCAGFADEDHVLVGNASQCPDEGLLLQLVTESDPADGVTLLVGGDGAPSGLLLVRCDALRRIPSIGYIDLKEQALPRIAAEFGARAIVNAAGGSPPIRSPGSYLEVVRSWHRCGSLRGRGALSPFEERWAPHFAVIEEGATVAESAKLYDSIVLAGGVVGHGAEVVRSVVGPGGRVRKLSRVLDRLVLPNVPEQGDSPRGQPRVAP